MSEGKKSVNYLGIIVIIALLFIGSYVNELDHVVSNPKASSEQESTKSVVKEYESDEIGEPNELNELNEPNEPNEPEETYEPEDDPFEEMVESLNMTELMKCYEKLSSDEIILIKNQLLRKDAYQGVVNGTIDKMLIEAVARFQFEDFYDYSSSYGIPTLTLYNGLGILEIQEVYVRLEKAYLQYNNSVGNEWGYSFYVNDKLLSVGSSTMISLLPSQSFKISGQVVEHDKVSDYGSASKQVSGFERGLEGTIVSDLEVVVRENRGRYAGNTAKWIFEFKTTTNTVLSLR